MASHGTNSDAELRDIIDAKDAQILKLRESLFTAWAGRDALAPTMSQGTDPDARRAEAENLAATLANELAGTKATLASEKEAYRRREAEILEANGQNRSLESQRQTAIEAVMGMVRKARSLQDKITNEKKLSVSEQNKLYHTALEELALQARNFLHKAKYAMESELKGTHIWAQLTASFDQPPESTLRAGRPEDSLSSVARQGDKPVLGFRATIAPAPPQPRAAKRKRIEVSSPESELESTEASIAKAVQGMRTAPAVQSITGQKVEQVSKQPAAPKLKMQATPGQKQLGTLAPQAASSISKPAFENSKTFGDYSASFRSTAKDLAPKGPATRVLPDTGGTETNSSRSIAEWIEEGRKRREAAILANEPPPPPSSLFSKELRERLLKPAPVLEDSEESD